LARCRFEPHLLFQVREDALDSQPQSCEGALAVVVVGGSFACRSEQLHPGACHPLVVGASPETLVGDHRFAGLDEVGQRLVLVLVGRHERGAKRQPAPIGAQHQPNTPHPFALGGAEAVGSDTGELTAPSPAGVVGDTDQRPVGEPGAARTEQADQPLLHDRQQPAQATQPAAVLRL
jgi:hypothetical protein